MKKILPVLLCYVLSTSQTYALSGGPVFGSGSVSPTGLFSGVLEGVTETDDSSANGPAIPGDTVGAVDNSATTPSNALGLFDLSVPSTGTASGTFVLFADGLVYTGTISASADPDTDKLLGIVEATSTIATSSTSFGSFGAVTTNVVENALGQLSAKVTAARNASASLGRLNGTANLDINYGQIDATTLEPVIARTITFNVIGFKQSSTATSSSSSIGTAAATGTGL